MKNDRLLNMRKYIRNYVEGGTYFFTLVTKNRKHLFQNPDLCDIFMTGVEKVKSLHPFDLIAYCLLPDHVHLLLSLPEGIMDYSNVIKEIKRYVTIRIRKHLDQKDLVIWQDRFWEHTIRDEHDMQTHYDYIHYNPVKHGYVESVDQWKWSSIDFNSHDKDINFILKQIDILNQKGYSFGE
jgi:putative transposase